MTKGEDGPVHYEVAITTEVVLTAKGKIVKAKEEDEDDEKPSAKGQEEEGEEDDEEDDDDEDESDEVKAKKGDKD